MAIFLIGIIFLASIAIWRWAYIRANKKFAEENEIRERLGLPILTRKQFDLQVADKARELRCGVNQHM